MTSATAHEKILVLDPGVTTGYCVAVRDRLVEVGVIPASLKEVNDKLFLVDPTVIVYEAFNRGGPFSAEHIFTVEVIAVIKLYLEMYPNVKGFTQHAQARRIAVASAKALLRGSQSDHAKSPHVLDAVSHLLAFRTTRIT